MGNEAFEVVQSSPGLWRWEIRRQDLVPAGLLDGFVCFSSKAAAAEDFAAHVQGHLDATGRWVLPKENVQHLVKAITAPCEECEGFHIGGVYWHERDPEGCNWSVSTLRGHGLHDACLACIQPAAIKLRRRYAIPDER